MNKQSAENIGRSYWNYRVIDHGHSFAIHEVYYERNGKLSAYTVDPVGITCLHEEGVDTLGEAVGMMRRALEEPVLTPEDFPPRRRRRANQ